MFSVSNILLGISAIFTAISFVYPNVLIFGMNDIFLNQGRYDIFMLQFFTSVFLHGSMMHLAANGIFLYVFGNQVEQILGTKKYVVFFILNSIFVGILLSVFSSGNTIGISGFCMALLSYYTLYLKGKKVEEYKGGITALAINVGIGFLPGISLVGHLFGAIFGVIYYFLGKDFFKKSMVGVREV